MAVAVAHTSRSTTPLQENLGATITQSHIGRHKLRSALASSPPHFRIRATKAHIFRCECRAKTVYLVISVRCFAAGNLMVVGRVVTMSGLLLSIMGISMGMPHCPMWKEIAPCSCRMTNATTTIECNKMNSYDQVVSLLNGHFAPSDRISLKVTFSQLEDLRFRNFKELNMSIVNLQLNHDGIGELEGSTFEGLNSVKFFSLADNNLGKVPEHLWKRMPAVGTIDLGRTRIRTLTKSNFKDLSLQCLVLAGNQLTAMDYDTFPKEMTRLHLGRNNLKTLNKTLTNLSELNWVFANSNELSDLEGELPADPKNLVMMHFSNNRIEKLPTQLKTLHQLHSLFLQHNSIRSLDGNLAKLRKLQRVVLEHNQINILTPDDFVEDEALQSLHLSHNEITSLNNSLFNLRNLNFLNLTFNLMTEFSFHEIAGLQELKSIDLSYNRIRTLIGTGTNSVEWKVKLTELKLDHNQIEALDAALVGLPELLRLNLSFNKLAKISPDDLIGLDQLRMLDVSHNLLTTLDETSKTNLPRLEELIASYNQITILERDFDGLPVLCHADFTNNKIVALGRDLVSKTKCKIGQGIQESTWGTLTICLQDNPILCDSALPEIMSTMEINHTRIYGVSHCPPLSEQPVTHKPNAYLGYIPETSPILSENVANNPVQDLTEPKKPIYNKHSAYGVVQLIPQQDSPSTDANNVTNNGTKTNETVIDPIKQEKQLTKLASEIEELRTRVEELASQNHILLQQPVKTTETTELNDEIRKP